MPKQFSDLGISAPIVKALTELKIVVPTEIQQKTIPLLLSNTTDLVGLAKTGTGKTAAFGLPILQLIDTDLPVVQAVILVPTRELGHQIFRNLVILSITPRSIRFYDNSVLTNFSSDHLGCQGRCNVFQQRLIY